MAVTTPVRRAGQTTEPSRTTSSGHRRRRDIQGLRAVAVLVVVLNHTDLGWLPGGYVGVDVFFVVSGFVITRSLMGGVHRPGVRLPAFYAARARRILPMSTLVLLVTVVASWRLLNVVRAGQTVTDAIWATFFGANLRFSRLGTDYFAAGLPQSPLRHYWSLAVEEQFYVVWPVLLWLLTSRRRGRTNRAALGERRLVVTGGLCAVIAASMWWSITSTASQPAAAYFSPLARAWELGVGCLLAIQLEQVARLPRAVRVTSSWLGLAAILGAAVEITADTPFPGYAAALPVFGTAAVILGGTGSGRGGAAALLGLRPMIAIGDRSYSFYLWHWPILVIAEGYAGAALPAWAELGLVAGAFGLSLVTYRWIERPFQSARWLSAETSTSLLLWPAVIAVLLAGCTWTRAELQARAETRTAAVQPAVPFSLTGGAKEVVDASDPAAEVARAVSDARSGDPVPAVLSPALDKVNKDFDYSVCYTKSTESAIRTCRYGDPGGSRSIGIIGDSHAMMWFPALDEAAKAHGWAIHTFFKPSCNAVLGTVPLVSGGNSNAHCAQWQVAAIKAAAGLRLDRVVVANYPGPLGDEEGHEITDLGAWSRRWSGGVAAAADELRTSGAKVTFLGDVSGLGKDPTDCLLGRRVTMRTCTYPFDTVKAQRNAATRSGALLGGAEYVSVDDWFCSGGACPAVIGGIVAYQDDNHVSRTYSLHLSEPLARRLGLTRK